MTAGDGCQPVLTAETTIDNVMAYPRCQRQEGLQLLMLSSGITSPMALLGCDDPLIQSRPPEATTDPYS